MRIPLVLVTIFCLTGLNAQTLRILDRADLQPIEHVLVYNQSQKLSSFSNRNGEVSLRVLKDSDTLIFQHASYQESVQTYAAIKRNRNQVLLTMRSYDLQQLTVSAQRWEQNREDISARITSIPAREVAFQNPQTAADLLSRSQEVFVQKSQLGGGSPMLRGFAANSVLMVVDGVRMNNAIYRSGNLHNVISLDPNFIDNTEVIFGPGSVIYGSDALGGVMVFNTVQPRLAVDDELTYSVKPMMRYGSVNNEKTGSLVFKIGGKKWGSATSYSFSDFGDLRTGSQRTGKFPDLGKRPEYAKFTVSNDTIIANDNENIMRPSGYKQWNLSQKIRFRPGHGSDFNYGFHYSESTDIPRFDRLIEYRQGNLRFAEWYYGPQRWMMHNLQIRLFSDNMLYDKSKIILAYQFNEESRHDRRFGNMTRTSRVENVHAYILNADFEKGLSETVDLFYGIEGLYSNVTSTASTTHIITNATGAASTRYPDGDNHYGSLAAYAFLKKEFSKKLILNSGLRYSRVMLQSTLVDTTFYNFPFNEINLNTGFFNGSLGLAMHPQENIQVNANISTGFRAPNLDDAGKIFESEPGNVVVPNPNLKSEYTLNSELGLIINGSNKFRFELNAFYTLLFDVMVRRDFHFLGSDSILYNGDMSKVQAIVNAGQGEIAGGFAGIRFNVLKNLSISSSLTYTYGMETGTDEKIPLKHIPPLFGATSVNFTHDRTRIEFSAVYNAAKKWNDLDPSEQAKTHIYTEDGSLRWFTLNLRASYQVMPQLQINAGVENILDRHYWPYASGIPAPGRNIYVAIRGNLSK
jgi:hemoglobin/transferrin/lactoferrin receptor protein